jgi:hypothetical protein
MRNGTVAPNEHPRRELKITPIANVRKGAKSFVMHGRHESLANKAMRLPVGSVILTFLLNIYGSFWAFSHVLGHALTRVGWDIQKKCLVPRPSVRKGK